MTGLLAEKNQLLELVLYVVVVLVLGFFSWLKQRMEEAKAKQAEQPAPQRRVVRPEARAPRRDLQEEPDERPRRLDVERWDRDEPEPWNHDAADDGDEAWDEPPARSRPDLAFELFRAATLQPRQEVPLPAPVKKRARPEFELSERVLADARPSAPRSVLPPAVDSRLTEPQRLFVGSLIFGSRSRVRSGGPRSPL